MKKEIKKQNRLLYYQLLIVIVVLIIIINCLLFTSLLEVSRTFTSLLQGNFVKKFVGQKLAGRHSYNIDHDVRALRSDIERGQFKYLDKYKLWTIITNNVKQSSSSSSFENSLNRHKEHSNNNNNNNYVNDDFKFVYSAEPKLWPKIPTSIEQTYDRYKPVVSYDRIIEQLIYKSEWLETGNQLNGYNPHTTIIKIKPERFDLKSNQELFLQEECAVKKCEITYDWNEADAIVFRNFESIFIPEEYNRTKEQIWIAYVLESPDNVRDNIFRRRSAKFNWTATYRRDSDIVTPYEKFVPYTETIEQYYSLDNLSYYDKISYYNRASNDVKRLIQGKRKSIVWFVSNCFTANSRERYAKSLSNHIDIDVYGRCGNNTCNKSNHSECLQMANARYKFYLAFENSNHDDYITEKFFSNGLGKNDPNHLIIPIVMGASKADYLRQAPRNSFIHIDDYESPQHLAEFLNLISKDDVLFYSYFIWKSMGAFTDTKFYCRACTMLHHARKNNLYKYYNDTYQWFSQKEGYKEIYTNYEYDNLFKN